MGPQLVLASMLFQRLGTAEASSSVRALTSAQGEGCLSRWSVQDKHLMSSNSVMLLGHGGGVLPAEPDHSCMLLAGAQKFPAAACGGRCAGRAVPAGAVISAGPRPGPTESHPSGPECRRVLPSVLLMSLAEFHQVTLLKKPASGIVLKHDRLMHGTIKCTACNVFSANGAHPALCVCRSCSLPGRMAWHWPPNQALPLHWIQPQREVAMPFSCQEKNYRCACHTFVVCKRAMNFENCKAYM